MFKNLFNIDRTNFKDKERYNFGGCKIMNILDKILQDNGIDITLIENTLPLTQKEDKDNFDETSSIMSDIQETVDNAMYLILNNAVIESSLDSDKKVERIGKLLEGVDIKDEQKEEFVKEFIDPIIQSCGILECQGEPKYVSGVVYEVSKILEFYKDPKNTEQLTEQEIQQSLEKILKETFNKYEVKDEDQITLIVENCSEKVEKGESKNYCYNLFELAEILTGGNKDLVLSEESKYIPQAVADAANKLARTGQGKGMSIRNKVGLGLGLAAAATIAGIIWKKTRDPKKVVASLVSAKSKCGSTKNPEICRQKYDAAIAKWNARAAKK